MEIFHFEHREGEKEQRCRGAASTERETYGVIPGAGRGAFALSSVSFPGWFLLPGVSTHVALMCFPSCFLLNYLVL